jgi:hypothetical protein
MDFVQQFDISTELCDEILSNLTITVKEKAAIEVDIPEIHEPLGEFMIKYLTTIEEFNYFGDISKLSFEFQNTMIRYIPPWMYQMYEHGEGGHFIFFMFLVDNDSVFEVFNPFIRGDVRFRPRKGLVIVIPAIWMFMFRHSDTGFKNSIFISGAIGINNLNNKQ